MFGIVYNKDQQFVILIMPWRKNPNRLRGYYWDYYVSGSSWGNLTTAHFKIGQS